MNLPFLSCKLKPEKRVCGLGSGFGSRISGLLVGVILVTGSVQPGQAQQASLSYRRGGTLTITGSVGTIYSIQSKTNLSPSATWDVRDLIQLPSSPYDWVDPSPDSGKARLYRVVATAPSSSSLVYVQPGTYLMGSPTNELDRFSDESPQTSVTISKGFWVATHPVTQQEYSSLMLSNPSAFTGDLSRPVEQVSWSDATNYCAALTLWDLAAHSIPAGTHYRLPTEAEWEYVARAGTTNRFFYGDDLDYSSLTNYAWFDENSDSESHPVAQKLANPWGLYDITGNVWEWCQDWYGPYQGGDVVDPQGSPPGDPPLRVLRGGSWADSNRFSRSACRIGDDPTARYDNYGFRIVLVSGP